MATTWHHFNNAVHIPEEQRDSLIQELLENLKVSPPGDYHYITTGDVLILGIRERGNISIKVLAPVRSADFPVDGGGDVYK